MRHDEAAGSRRFSRCLAAALIIMAFLGECRTLIAQYPREIVEVKPAPNRWLDKLTSPVSVTFSENPPPISKDNFVVFGDQTGLYSGSFDFDQGEMKVTFAHDAPFKVGEKVTVILRSDIISGDPGGFMWSFYPSPSRGTGIAPDSIVVLSGVAHPVSLAAGDFNGDGFVDLASADMSSNTVTLFMGDCQTLTRVGSFRTNTSPSIIVTGDINGDRMLDIVVGHFFEQRVTAHVNLGNWNFTGPGRSVNVSPVNPVDIEIVEFTGDERLDAIVAGGNSVGLLENRGGGVMTLLQTVSVSTDSMHEAGGSFPSNVHISAGDIDLDGYIDFLLSVNTDYVVRKYQHKRKTNLFREAFDEMITLPDKPIMIRLADLDSNGFLDLVAATEGFPNQHLLTYWNDGSGVITPDIQQDITGLSLPSAFNLVATNPDPENDGTTRDFDMLATDRAEQKILFFRNDNGGNLELQPDIPAGSDPEDIIGADFNLDGAMDYAVPCSRDNAIWLYLSRITPTWDLKIDPDHVDFGAVAVCEAETASVQVTNESGVAVEIDTLFIETGTAFRITKPFNIPDKIVPGDTLMIYVEYQPVAPAADTDRLILVSERCDVQTQVVDLEGSAILPIEHSPDSIQFPATTVGDTAADAVALNNLGARRDIEIVAGLANGSDAFTISTMPCGSPPETEIQVVIPPGASFEICTLFHPADTGSYADTLVIEPAPGESCDFQSRRIPLSGVGRSNSRPFFTDIPDSADLVYPEWEDILIPLFGIDLDSSRLDMSFDSLATEIPYEILPAMRNVQSPCGEYTACGDLGWTAPVLPDSIQSAVFLLYCTLMETGTRELLSDTLRLPVTVVQRLPDLRVAAISASGPSVVGRTVGVETAVTVDNQDIPLSAPSFILRLSSDEGEERVHSIERLDAGEFLSFQDNFTFRSTGGHRIDAMVDFEDVIEEDDEDNNTATLDIPVERGKLAVRHDPFTPNGDGFNDRVEFDLTELGLDSPELIIFAIDGRRVRVVREKEGSSLYWDGRDDSGREQRPGAYLFVLEEGGNGIDSGTIGLVR